MVMTTIGISKETRDRLDRKKIHPRQSYEEVIKRLLVILGVLLVVVMLLVVFWLVRLQLLMPG